MRSALAALLLAGCAPSGPPVAAQASACREERFEASAFTVCEPGRGEIRIVSEHRSFADLGASLGPRAQSVAFAMNAGMFDDSGAPIGLMIEDGRLVHRINVRKGGGNFHLMPNGVFLVRRGGSAEVVSSAEFKPAGDIAYASQSGPMLLIDGKLHPKFENDGQSRYIRNGVGVTSDGRPSFVISLDAVSLGKMARFMRDRLHHRNALYFDGSVSSLWDPADHRMDSFTRLGPILVVFRPAGASARNPAAPSRP